MAMYVGCIKTNGREHVGIHGGTERQMSAQAYAYNAQASRAVSRGVQVVEQSTSIAVVGGYRLLELVRISPIGTLLIVGEHLAGRLQFVINLGNSHNVAMAGDRGGKPANGTR